MTIESALRGMISLVAGMACAAYAAPTLAQTAFAPGSYVIPMDTGVQNNGILRAYGLAYELARRGVPVNWVISPTKPPNGDDFSVADGALIDVRTGAAVPGRGFRGGPFVVASADAAAALPIIQAWQATPGDATTVHRLQVASPPVTVARTISRAPRIAVLLDGNQTIAFNNLNAAGIRDAIGNAWTAASPDLVSEADVAGPSAVNHADGLLSHAGSGLPRYCVFASLHNDGTPSTAEVVQETRRWLDFGPLTHLYAQCAAIDKFENSVAGLLLTNGGISDDGSAAISNTLRAPSAPDAQYDGVFEVDSGAIDSFTGIDPPGATPPFKTGVTTLINESSAPLVQRIALLTGRMDGDNANGRVTYLAGHDYTLDLPVTSNPQTNGVRIFLDAIFASDCAFDPGQDLGFVQSGATTTTGSVMAWTFTVGNPGPRPAENLRLTARIPAGASFAGASPGGTPSGGSVVWNLAPLGPGAQLSVQYSASVPATPASDGNYTSTASLQVATLDVRQVESNAVTTTRDTTPPTIAITGGPTGPSNDDTPTYTFTAGADAVSVACRMDSDAFVDCSSGSFTAAPLLEGGHTFHVRVIDAAGNSATATRTLNVDVTAPTVDVTGGPTGATNDNTPTFAFAAGADATSVECRIDSNAFVGCSGSSFTATALSDGAHTFQVLARDAAGNAGTASRSFSVDTTAPTVTIPGEPVNAVATSDTTPTIVYSVSEAPVTTQCAVAAIAGPCTSPYTVPSALADGLYVISITPTDAGGNVGPTAQFQFAVDTVAPRVSSLDSIAKADWTQLGPARLRNAVTRVLIGFDDQMRTATVLDGDNWRLVSAGSNGSIDTTGCTATGGDDVALATGAIEFAAAPRLAAVSVGTGAGLQAGTYRLFACPGVLDYAGNGLDGAANGGGAEAFAVDFVSLTNPRPLNPNFDTDLSGWSFTAPGTAPWERNNIDGENQPFSGAARVIVDDVAAGQQWRMEQCVALADVGVAAASALVRTSSLTAGAPTVRETIAWFPAPACGGTAIATDNAVLAGDTNGWRTIAIAPATPPAGAVSLRIGFEIDGGAADTLSVDVDRVRYPDLLLLFKDGFEVP